MIFDFELYIMFKIQFTFVIFIMWFILATFYHTVIQDVDF